MPAPFAPVEEPRTLPPGPRYGASDAAAKTAALAEMAKGRPAPRPKAPRAMLTIKPDATVRITTDGKVPGEALIRTREQVARAALMAERGRLLQRQRSLESQFIRESTPAVALRLAAVRERLSTLELAVAGVVLDG